MTDTMEADLQTVWQLVHGHQHALATMLTQKQEEMESSQQQPAGFQRAAAKLPAEQVINVCQANLDALQQLADNIKEAEKQYYQVYPSTEAAQQTLTQQLAKYIAEAHQQGEWEASLFFRVLGQRLNGLRQRLLGQEDEAAEIGIDSRPRLSEKAPLLEKPAPETATEVDDVMAASPKEEMSPESALDEEALDDEPDLSSMTDEEILAAHAALEEELAAPEAMDIALEDGIEVYVLLYQSIGDDLERWADCLQDMNTKGHQRPVYLSQADVEAFIDAQEDTSTYAYIIAMVHLDDIQEQQGSLKTDDMGYELLVLKEKSLWPKNISAFYHAGRHYVLADGQLTPV